MNVTNYKFNPIFKPNFKTFLTNSMLLNVKTSDLCLGSLQEFFCKRQERQRTLEQKETTIAREQENI